MKQVVVLLFVLIYMNFLEGITIEVNIDGTGDYLTIQEGIDASSDGDTVLVYPGRYFEHVNYNGKTITVGSLNLTTGERHYIRETIIDGSDNGSCVRVDSGEGPTTVIHGLTLTHGAGDLTHPQYRSGGGILLLYPSYLRVINCIITRNRASRGGGILTSSSHIYLEGTTISFNRSSRYYSGGLSSYQSEVVFSEKNRCNIYNNYGHYANDVCTGGGGYFTVIVDTFTVLEPDLYYLMNFNNLQGFEYFAMSYDIQHGYIEQVDSDLYIAPDGDDYNNGLNAGEPMKTIADALIRIRADENDPHTIFLAPGRYSSTENGQIFSLHLKCFISLQGAGMYETILDGEDYYNILYDITSQNGYTLKDFSIENAFSPVGVEPFSSNYCCYLPKPDNCEGNLLIENVRFAYCGDGSDPGLGDYTLIQREQGFDATNILMENNESRISGFKLYGSQYLSSRTTNIINTVIRNNDNFKGLTYFGQRTYDNLNIIGLEFTGNHFDDPGYVPEDEYNQCLGISGPGNVNIINCTISDNTSANDHGHMTAFYYSMNVNIINTIISGYPYYAIRRYLENGEDPQYMLIDHCLIEGGYNDINGAFYPELTYGFVMEGDPFFAENAEYPYYLAYNSPCIGAGTLDLPEGVELPEYDAMGNSRIMGSLIDIGAYEWNGFSIDPWGTSTGEGVISVANELFVYPNPIIPGKMRDGRVRIEWRGEDISGDMSFEIFNVRGQKIRTMCIDETRNSELETRFAEWDLTDNAGSRVSSGVYFIRMKSDGEYKAQRKVVLCN
ncbi:MAG: hypothetical protein K9N06_03420 [Candidatus Cloacimonetes bacterium]|nr:hypothetical protein [Candidatus Cloacimonadota bacterium]